MRDLAALNALDDQEARIALLRCCGSERWATRMAALRPFASAHALFSIAERVWRELAPADWREAFAAHPRIGDLDALKSKCASTEPWSSAEQASVVSASDATLHALAHANAEYEARFGFIFIVCATGKTAGEMLAMIQERLGNEPAAELLIAALEQAKITRLRLRKLCAMSPITTHVLDTARGLPAAEVAVTLERKGADGQWIALGHGTTNADGRIPSLLPADVALEAGVYRLRFATQGYFARLGIASLYPEVHVVFEVQATHEHYHIPLLLSAFGYSTYRGS